jgi:hypothetical protein
MAALQKQQERRATLQKQYKARASLIEGCLLNSRQTLGSLRAVSAALKQQLALLDVERSKSDRCATFIAKASSEKNSLSSLLPTCPLVMEAL